MSGKPGVIRIEAIGTRKILRKLDALPARIREKIVKKVISKGTTILKREIVKRAPVGTGNPVDGNGNPRKRLKKSFTKRTVTAKGKMGVHGIVGIDADYPRFVYMLHHGIKPFIVGGKFAGARHPGVSKMNFMRDALTATIPKARSVMASQLKTGLASVAK
jgi:hypothetical protein